MKDCNLEIMSVDELWELHKKLQPVLAAKIGAEKLELERRLARLGERAQQPKKQSARRPYPKVVPKYRNPDRPFETWSGRGKHPHWVDAQLKRGKRVDDLLISRAH